VPAGYKVFLLDEVFHALESLDETGRFRVLDFCTRLGGQPNLAGDFSERGADGRTHEVKILGPFAVAWSVDYAVKEIKVVALRAADSAS
jgi:hypothetical protein